MFFQLMFPPISTFFPNSVAFIGAPTMHTMDDGCFLELFSDTIILIEGTPTMSTINAFDLPESESAYSTFFYFIHSTNIYFFLEFGRVHRSPHDAHYEQWPLSMKET